VVSVSLATGVTFSRVPTPGAARVSSGPERYAGEALLEAAAALRASFSCEAVCTASGVVSGGLLDCIARLITGEIDETASIAI
jgi:hypothetical protein